MLLILGKFYRRLTKGQELSSIPAKGRQRTRELQHSDPDSATRDLREALTWNGARSAGRINLYLEGDPTEARCLWIGLSKEEFRLR